MASLDEFKHNGVMLKLDLVLPREEVRLLGRIIDRTNDYIMQQADNVRLTWMPEQRAQTACSMPAHESYRLIGINDES